MDKRLYQMVKINDVPHRLGFSIFGYSYGGKTAPVVIPQPNLITLYLSISDKAYTKARDLFDNTIEPSLNYHADSDQFIIDNDRSFELIFDLLEEIITSITFAYSSLEAFANSLIPHNYRKEEKVKRGKIIIDCEFIQRKYDLKKKLKKIIPSVYNFNFEISHSKTWQDFHKIKHFRDELTHLKQEQYIKTDSGQYASKQSDFLQSIIGPFLRDNIIACVREIIQVFVHEIFEHEAFPQEFGGFSFNLEEIKRKVHSKNIVKTINDKSE